MEVARAWSWLLCGTWEPVATRRRSAHWTVGPSGRRQGDPQAAETVRGRVPMRGTGAGRLVVAARPRNAGGAKGRVVRARSAVNHVGGRSRVSEPKPKPFAISKRAVWEAWLRVKANGGAAGVDEQSRQEFERDLRRNRYKLWNRLSSGSYFPPPAERFWVASAEGPGAGRSGHRGRQPITRLHPAHTAPLYPDGRSTIVPAGPVANSPSRRSGSTPTRDQRDEATHYLGQRDRPRGQLLAENDRVQPGGQLRTLRVVQRRQALRLRHAR